MPACLWVGIFWLLVHTCVLADNGFPDDDLEQRVEQVNEGELRFLSEPPAKPVHHHRNQIVIDAKSLEDGWVLLEQCHFHLDPVPEAQILYHPQRTRAIELLEQRNIGHARVEGATVQLTNIAPDARLCLRIQTRALEALGSSGDFRLRNGPFMRRFLDGYYPMHVSMTIVYPSDLLHLTHSFPDRQPGLALDVTPGSIQLDAWFEGRLTTEFQFCHRNRTDCGS